VILCVALLVIASGIFAARSIAEETEGQPEEARRARQLQKMKLSAAQYKIAPADDRQCKFKFIESPALRWTNPVGGAKDGTVFLWTDRGRPQAVLQLFTYDDDHFSHEWQSLAEGALTAEHAGQVVWNPEEPGIRFRELPDADAPAATASGRLRQMKALAAKFSAIFTGFAQSPTPAELRLLTQPLWRYETADDPRLVDGALFAFAQGTDPQALLLLEARTAGTDQRWHFAFARMASGAVTGRYGDQEVFSVSKYDFSRDTKKTFLLLPQQPVPNAD
jgi:hypothetical protein